MAIIRIRCDIIDHMNEIDEYHRMINEISSVAWRSDAKQKYDELKVVIKNMANGYKRIPPGKITKEEQRLLEGAENSVYSLNFIHSKIELEMRLPRKVRTNPLNGLLNAHRNPLCKVGNKKRVVILDDSKIDLETDDVQAMIKELDEFNRKPYAENGMNFDVRFIVLSKLKEEQIAETGNLLMVDEKEATVVTDKTSYPADYLTCNGNISRDLECYGYIDRTELEKQKEIFHTIWAKALSADYFLKERVS